MHAILMAFQEQHTLPLEPNDYSPSNGDFNVRIYGFGIVAVGRSVGGKLYIFIIIAINSG